MTSEAPLLSDQIPAVESPDFHAVVAQFSKTMQALVDAGIPLKAVVMCGGDKRFSAFAARLRGRGNRSIEEIYQGSKVMTDGSTNLPWREAKGKLAVNQAFVTALYATLWDEYLQENPALLDVLTAASGLSDRFGQPGRCCQATELWRIRAEHLALRDEPAARPAP